MNRPTPRERAARLIRVEPRNDRLSVVTFQPDDGSEPRAIYAAPHALATAFAADLRHAIAAVIAAAVTESTRP